MRTEDNNPDLELRRLLHEWQAPDAPPSLDRRVLDGRGRPWWRFLLTGYIRIPVPLACVLALLLSGVAWKYAFGPPAPCQINQASAPAPVQDRCGHLAPGPC